MRPSRQLREAMRRPQRVVIVEPKRRPWIGNAGFWREATAQAVGGLMVAVLIAGWAAWSGYIPWPFVLRLAVFLVLGGGNAVMLTVMSAAFKGSKDPQPVDKLWRGFWLFTGGLMVVLSFYLIFFAL